MSTDIEERSTLTDDLIAQVPDANRSIHAVLYALEVGLREFIIEVLSSKAGPRWWKERLPRDVLEQYRRGVEYERQAKWTSLVPHHPLYYIDFPALRQVIEGRDNWRDAFKETFARKSVVTATLEELEPVRNKVAHNRKATASDVELAKTALAKISTAIGETRFAELVRKPSQAPDIFQTITALKDEARAKFEACSQSKELPPLEMWRHVESSWWFDDVFLGKPTEAITRLFEIFSTYEALPRYRGSGHKTDKWVSESDIKDVFDWAEKEFAALLAEERSS